MAKMDTGKIEGYAQMTAEQKVAALEAMEIEDPDFTGWVKKETFDQTASDAAKWKRQYNELLKSSGTEKSANEEALEALRGEVAELKKERTIGNYRANLLAQGYSEDLAEETASAMAEGDMEKVFANMKAFQAEREKQIRADALKKTPQPDGGKGGEGGMTLEKLRKLSQVERHKFSVEHPDIYKQLYGG